MINNFNLIRPLLSFKEGDFYYLQILKRRKDNPGMMGDSIVIDNYYISSMGMFDLIEEKVIEKCTLNNARAYLRLNRRNFEKVGLQTLKKVTEYIINNDYRAIKNAYQSACGEFHSDENKKWIVDIDDEGTDMIELQSHIDSLSPKGPKCLEVIPTKNGCHLITNPFRLDEFRKIYPKIDIHKDNPTILYCL